MSLVIGLICLTLNPNITTGAQLRRSASVEEPLSVSNESSERHPSRDHWENYHSFSNESSERPPSMDHWEGSHSFSSDRGDLSAFISFSNDMFSRTDVHNPDDMNEKLRKPFYQHHYKKKTLDYELNKLSKFREGIYTFHRGSEQSSVPPGSDESIKEEANDVRLWKSDEFKTGRMFNKDEKVEIREESKAKLNGLSNELGNIVSSIYEDDAEVMTILTDVIQNWNKYDNGKIDSSFMSKLIGKSTFDQIPDVIDDRVFMFQNAAKKFLNINSTSDTDTYKRAVTMMWLRLLKHFGTGRAKRAWKDVEYLFPHLLRSFCICRNEVFNFLVTKIEEGDLHHTVMDVDTKMNDYYVNMSAAKSQEHLRKAMNAIVETVRKLDKNKDMSEEEKAKKLINYIDQKNEELTKN